MVDASSPKKPLIKRAKPYTLCIAIGVLLGVAYVIEGFHVAINNHTVQLMSSQCRARRILVDGKPTRIVFGYYVVVQPGIHEITADLGNIQVTSILEVHSSSEEYLNWDCHAGGKVELF